MAKTPLTKEQKEWFIQGYFYCQAQSFAEEFGYTVEQAKEILLIALEEKICQEKKKYSLS